MDQGACGGSSDDEPPAAKRKKGEKPLRAGFPVDMTAADATRSVKEALIALIADHHGGAAGGCWAAACPLVDDDRFTVKDGPPLAVTWTCPLDVLRG